MERFLVLRSSLKGLINIYQIEFASYLIKRLSQELSDEYGTGFSVANIRNCRQLYLTCPKESYGYSLIGKIHWSHLRTITRLDIEKIQIMIRYEYEEIAQMCLAAIQMLL